MFSTVIIGLSITLISFAGAGILPHQQDFSMQSVALCTTICLAVLSVERALRSRELEHQTQQLARAAEALRESEARFRDFALTASDWFWETDSEHRFTYTSDSIRVFGQDPDTRLGRTRRELAADADGEPEKWRDHLALLDRHEEFRDFAYVRKLGDQPEHVLSVSGKPHFDASGRFLGYRGTARDVTDKVQAERRLQEAKLAAEAANHSKSQFLANMSHELRTPLNAILGFAEMLAIGLRGPLPSEQREYAELIHTSGAHLLSIINDVLDLAKIDAGKFTLEEETLDPRELVAECMEVVKETAAKSEVDLLIWQADAVPGLRGDARRLRQALLNVLSNAIKFTNPGGRVLVRTDRTDDGGMIFEVRDTGIGMTPAEMAIALETFGQVDAGFSRQHQGTGLGLPLARSFVELHGGALQIERNKDRGTTVIMRLPATPCLPSTSKTN